MQFTWAFTLLLAMMSSVTQASDSILVIEANTTLEQIANKTLRKDSGSYDTSAREFWTTYVEKYGHLTKLNVHDLSDEALLASAEIFTGMAAPTCQH